MSMLRSSPVVPVSEVVERPSGEGLPAAVEGSGMVPGLLMRRCAVAAPAAQEQVPLVQSAALL